MTASCRCGGGRPLGPAPAPPRAPLRLPPGPPHTPLPPSTHANTSRQLYRTFISAFESHLSQLHVVLIAATVSQQLYPTRPYAASELDAAAAFLQAFQDKPRGRDGALEAPCFFHFSFQFIG